MSQENSTQPKQGWAPVQYFEESTVIHFERSNIALLLKGELNRFFTPLELEHDARRFTMRGAKEVSNRAAMPLYVDVTHGRDVSVSKARWCLMIRFRKVGNPTSVIVTIPYYHHGHGMWRAEEHITLDLRGHMNAIAKMHRWKHVVFLNEWIPTRHPKFTLTRERDGTLLVTALFGKMHEREHRKFYNTQSREKK